MTFKFSEIEGIDAELAATLDANESITKAVTNYATTSMEEAVTNRTEVARTEFKTKMNALDAKLKDAQAKADNAPDIDPEELKALKMARDKNPELQATLDAMKKRTDEAEGALKKQTDQLMNMQKTHAIQEAINQYDSEHPTVSVRPDAKDLISMLAGDTIRYDEDAKSFRVYGKTGELLATDKGAATPVDWLDMLRGERPSLFNAPSGSGATGSNGSPSGSASNTMTRAEFDALPQAKQATVARTHTFTD